MRLPRRLPLSIEQLRNGYKNGEFNPIEVTERLLKSCEDAKDLNAFTRLCSVQALANAKESVERFANGNSLSQLDGVPFAIKDNYCTKGTVTSCASKMLENFVSPYNATVYQRLLDAGGIPMGKTNMDEFAMGSGTIDSIYGPTKNVWNADLRDNDWHIAGGSSGGSATAVAAGLSYIGIGSDTGGSVRNPACYSGLIGLKPTYGLVSRYGLIPLVNSMDCPGIFTRSVDDCVAALNVIAGHDPKDSTCISKNYASIELDENFSMKNVRIGIPKEYHCEGLSNEVLEIWIKVADMLETEGVQVRQCSMPNTSASIFVYTILNQAEVASNMARYDGIEYGYRADEDLSTEHLFSKSRTEGLDSVVQSRIMGGNYFLLRSNYEKYFIKAMAVRRLIYNDFRSIFGLDQSKSNETVDLLLTPCTLSDAPLYSEFSESSNRDQCAVQDFCTQPANMSGVPAITFPVKLSTNNLPLGLQLMGPPFSEKLLFSVARWLEAELEFKIEGCSRDYLLESI